MPGDIAEYLLSTEDPYHWVGHSIKIKKCRRCGETPLFWIGRVAGVWRLGTEDGKLHTCKQEQTGDDIHTS